MKTFNQFVNESKSKDLDLTPPAKAQKNAQQALDWKDEHGDDIDAGTKTGWTRANQLAKGSELSPDIVKRMASFNRHRKNSKISDKHKDEPWKDNGHIMWLAWGGDEGIDWALEMSKKLDNNE